MESIEQTNVTYNDSEVKDCKVGLKCLLPECEFEATHPAKVYTHMSKSHDVSLRCRICQINDRTWDATTKAELEEHLKPLDPDLADLVRCENAARFIGLT